MKKNWYLILGLAIVVHLLLLIKLGFTAWPEMTFWPYLILKGWLPYKDIAIAHTPLLLVNLTAFYKIFGLGLIQLKIYTWIVILLTDILLFLIAQRLWEKKVALFSLIFFIPLQVFYEGNGLWFDLALAFLALLIYYCLEKKKYIWAGIFWMFAFLTKQTAFWFLIPMALMILKDINGRVIKEILKGSAIVFIPFIIAMLLLRILPDFWLWAIKFGITKLPASSGQIQMPSLRQFAVATLPLLLLAIATLRIRKSYAVLAWGIFASLGFLPRWGLFHFQPALPFWAIGFALLINNFGKIKLNERVIFSLGIVIIAVIISRQVVREWRRGDRFFEPAVLRTAEYIRQNSVQGESVYIINTWDSIYALSGTIPSTRPWLPYLPWYLEISGIQDAIVANLELVSPKLIVAGEFQKEAYQAQGINNFITENYKLSDQFEGYLIYRPKD